MADWLLKFSPRAKNVSVFCFFIYLFEKRKILRKNTSKQTARLVSSGKPRCPFYLFIYWFSSFTAVCSASYPHDLWPPSENKVSLPADGRFFVLRDFLLLLVCSFLLFAFFFSFVGLFFFISVLCWFVYKFIYSLKKLSSESVSLEEFIFWKTRNKSFMGKCAFTFTFWLKI